MSLFPQIHNLSAIIKEHPAYHPDSKSYLDYWREQKKYCVEGYWYEDLPNQWRFAPPQLYFYANMGTIIRTDHKTKARKKERPLIRDVEWIIYTAYLVCRGFSGFSDDKEYTSNLAVRDNIQELITPTCKKKDGSLKTFIDPLEYLKQLHPNQLGVPLYENPAQNLFLLGSRGLGKDVHEDTLVHSETGSYAIKHIKVGDRIYGADGKLTTVLKRFDFNDQEQFRVTLSDKRSVLSGLGHLWGVYQKVGNKLKYVVKELREIKEDYLVGKRQDARYFVPQTSPVEYPEKQHYIDPYVLGSLLGDGCLRQGITFTTADTETVTEINTLLQDDYQLHKVLSSKHSYCLRKTTQDTKGQQKYIAELKRLELYRTTSHTKFIPKQYLLGSVNQRLALLQGLMDTDGYVTSTGDIEYSTVSNQLKEDFLSLVRSLGIVAKCTDYPTKYRIHLKTSLPIFRLERKLKRLNTTPSKYTTTNRTKLAIKSIVSEGVNPSVCISVDNNDKLFLVNDYVVTHNSYTIAHAILHELVFDGAKYYTKDSIKYPNKAEIFVGAFKADKSTDLLSKVEQALVSMPGAFGSSSNYRPAPFYKEMSGTLKAGNSKSVYEHSYKKKENGNWVTAGTGSRILHEIFTVENPQAATGYRPSLLVIEEVGLLPNLKEVHGANLPTQSTDGLKFGSSVYIGTGGNMEKIIESEYVFRRPKDYDMLAFEDIWENTGEIGLFIPVQYTYNDLKDSNGNTIFESANKRVAQERKNKRGEALQHLKVSYPTVPSEMFMSERGNLFPKEEIQNQLKFLIKNQRKVDALTNYGSLVFDFESSNGIAFKQDTSGDHVPITDFPTKKGLLLKGAVTIYEHPPEVIPNGLYKVVYDPVRDDDIFTMSKGVSLAAIYVYKAAQKFDGVYDQLVAHYVGRYPDIDVVHDIAIKLALYYNAKILVEMNLPGFYKHCIHKKYLALLEPTPYLTIGKISPNTTIRNKYGIYMTTPLILQAEQYLIRWLLEVREQILDEAGNVTAVKRNINFIYDKALLEELLNYNRVINTDRVSALLMLMLWLEEAKEMPPVTQNDVNLEHPMLEYLSSGNLFARNKQPNKIKTGSMYSNITFPTLHGQN